MRLINQPLKPYNLLHWFHHREISTLESQNIGGIRLTNLFIIPIFKKKWCGVLRNSNKV